MKNRDKKTSLSHLSLLYPFSGKKTLNVSRSLAGCYSSPSFVILMLSEVKFQELCVKVQ